MSECKSREELDAMLAALEAEMPALIAKHAEEGDFDFCEFAGHADHIEDSAGPDDREYVHGKIQCLLGSAGLIPSDNEGEPCITEDAKEAGAAATSTD